MNNTPYYLFVGEDAGVPSFISGYNLPFSDTSIFVSGFLISYLDDQKLEEYQKEFNEIKNARRSQYYLGQTILEDHEPKTDEPFSLLDKGFFVVTLSGPGYNNTDNHSKFEGNWEKVSIKDVLTIKPDFTWERSKEIDNGFYLKWNGTYSYTDKLVVFSLSEQGYSGEFSSITENYIP